MVKRVVFILLVLVGTFLIWYLGIKSSDLKVSFKVDTLPGVAGQTIKRWAITQKGSEIDLVSRYNFFQETTDLQIEWKIEHIDDSSSQVEAYISFHGSKIHNRLKLIFPSSDLKEDGYNLVREAYNVIHDHLTKIKVEINGKSKIPSKFCACVQERTSQLWKAQGMMRNHGLISSFILSNNLETDGLPFIEVEEWDQEIDSLRFNFCFPIKKQGELPESELLFYHAIQSREAILATYNGNYITSDRAWYELLNYAKDHNFDVVEKPIEFFYNNPNVGENELRWKTEIFLPIK